MIQSTSLIGRSIFNISIENITKTRRRIVEVVPRRENCVFFSLKETFIFFPSSWFRRITNPPHPHFFLNFFFHLFLFHLAAPSSDFLTISFNWKWGGGSSGGRLRPLTTADLPWYALPSDDRAVSLSLSLSLFVKKKKTKKKEFSVSGPFSRPGVVWIGQIGKR